MNAAQDQRPEGQAARLLRLAREAGLRPELLTDDELRDALGLVHRWTVYLTEPNAADESDAMLSLRAAHARTGRLGRVLMTPAGARGQALTHMTAGGHQTKAST